jgi:nitrile hydratase
MSARFRPGDRVAVRWADPIGHIRTPHYVRGKTGEVERICGEFANPEELAFGRDGLPRRPLYRVRFLQSEVWPDYRGRRSDTVDVEIYEHWLDPAKG